MLFKSIAAAQAASLAASFTATLISVTPSSATSNMWLIDPDHSNVTFKVKHMAVSSVTGRFKTFSGTVNYDGRNLRDAAVEAKINTQSVDTNSKKRDEHLMGKSFFDAKEYPNISFKSQKIVPQDRGFFQIKGVISMHGYSQEVTLDAEPLKEIVYAGTGSRHLVTSATTYLNRKDFQMSMGALDKGGALIGDKVQVTLNIELVHSENAASPSPGPFNPFRRSGNLLRMQMIRVADQEVSNNIRVV